MHRRLTLYIVTVTCSIAHQCYTTIRVSYLNIITVLNDKDCWANMDHITSGILFLAV